MGVGEERWRRSLRPVRAVATAWCLAPLFLLASSSLTLGLRLVAGLFAVVSVASALDAWKAGIVVGSEGIWVRRTMLRHELPWSEIEGFEARPKGLAGERLQVQAVLGRGRPRPLSDEPLPLADGRRLLEDLSRELEASRR